MRNLYGGMWDYGGCFLRQRHHFFSEASEASKPPLPKFQKDWIRRSILWVPKKVPHSSIISNWWGKTAKKQALMSNYRVEKLKGGFFRTNATMAITVQQIQKRGNCGPNTSSTCIKYVAEPLHAQSAQRSWPHPPLLSGEEKRKHLREDTGFFWSLVHCIGTVCTLYMHWLCWACMASPGNCWALYTCTGTAYSSFGRNLRSFHLFL